MPSQEPVRENFLITNLRFNQTTHKSNRSTNKPKPSPSHPLTKRHAQIKLTIYQYNPVNIQTPNIYTSSMQVTKRMNEADCGLWMETLKTMTWEKNAKIFQGVQMDSWSKEFHTLCSDSQKLVSIYVIGQNLEENKSMKIQT